MFMMTHLIGFGVGDQGSSTALGISGTPVTTTQQNVAYAGFTVTATGGTAPYTYSVHTGTLPTGITLNSSTGAVSGTPTTIGTSTGIVIRVTDNVGATADLAPFNLQVYGDLYWANVMLLIGFDGTDGATSATDDSLSAHSLSFNGNAQLDTGVSPPFGTASLLLDGSGDFVSTPDSADFDFGSGNFTVEAFVRTAANANNQTIVSQYASVGSDNAWELQANVSPGLTGRFSPSGTSGTNVVGGTSLTATTWHHVCFERSGTKYRLYIDGTMVGSNTDSSTLHNSAYGLRIGARDNNTGYFNGWIKEIRITKGVARYNSDSGFTAPTAAFPRG